MESELELLVRYDMYINGYDPNDPKDIETYWKEKLNDTCDNIH